MMIQNFKELATSQKKNDTLEILESGLEASMPETILPKFVTPNKITAGTESLKLDKFSNIYTVAFGKAADSMTRAINAIIPIHGGIIVILRNLKWTPKNSLTFRIQPKTRHYYSDHISFVS